MFSNSLVSSTNLVSKFVFSSYTCAARSLYSAASLGIDKYLSARERKKTQFQGIESKFKDKMANYANPDTSSTIFTEDLKNMVYIVEPNDLDLINLMIAKFAHQNKEIRFGSFIFGPIIMRMYYHFNEPSQALQSFKTLHSTGIYDQLISYQILMDLLLKNKMFNEVIEVFEIIKGKELQGNKYPKNAVTLVFATCYKLDSPESFEYAKSLWIDLNKLGYAPMRKAGTFAAALALSQNAPDIALEMLSAIKNQSYVTIRNLKVVSLVDLGRPEDTLTILRTVLETDAANFTKHTFLQEVISKVIDSVQKLDNKEITEEFNRIVNQLKSLGHIVDDPLDTLLCAEIDNPPFQMRQPQHQETHRHPRQNEFSTRFRRPGLRDMI